MTATCDLLPVVRVGEISRKHKGQRWLVEQLWGETAWKWPKDRVEKWMAKSFAWDDLLR